MSAPVDQTVDALGRAVIAADAGRRVGWARAFSAEASKEDLSREINILRSERDIMRRSASFNLGVLHALTTALGIVNSLRVPPDVEAVLDAVVIGAGRDLGRELAAEIPQAVERIRAKAEVQQAKRDHARTHQREFAAARTRERRHLIERFGFPNEAAFLNYLEAYRGDAG